MWLVFVLIELSVSLGVVIALTEMAYPYMCPWYTVSGIILRPHHLSLCLILTCSQRSMFKLLIEMMIAIPNNSPKWHRCYLHRPFKPLKINIAFVILIDKVKVVRLHVM